MRAWIGARCYLPPMLRGDGEGRGGDAVGSEANRSVFHKSWEVRYAFQ
jgi:hypothetical protein